MEHIFRTDHIKSFHLVGSQGILWVLFTVKTQLTGTDKLTEIGSFTACIKLCR